jgi:hypothetical protein
VHALEFTKWVTCAKAASPRNTMPAPCTMSIMRRYTFSGDPGVSTLSHKLRENQSSLADLDLHALLAARASQTMGFPDHALLVAQASEFVDTHENC